MSGIYNGCQALITRLEPRAVYVYCSNHQLNLILQEMARFSILIRDILGLVHEIGKLFKSSAKKCSILNRISMDEIGAPAMSLGPLCETRWCCRQKAIDKVVNQYLMILEAMEEIGSCDSWKREDAGAVARGIAKTMSNFGTLFGLYVAHAIFGVCEDLAISLQSQKATITGTVESVRAIQLQLEKKKSKDFLHGLWDKSVANGKKWNLSEPQLPRKRTPSKKIIESMELSDSDLQFIHLSSSSAKEELVNQAMEAITKIEEELKRRFENEGVRFAVKSEELLLKACRGIIDESLAKDIVIHLKDDLDIQIFLRHLHNLSSLCSACKSVDEIRMVFVDLRPETLKLVDQITILIRILASMSTSNANNERSFSTLRRLKTWLRSTISQARLTHLAMLHVYKEETENLNPKKIMKIFVEAKEGRKNDFGVVAEV